MPEVVFKKANSPTTLDMCDAWHWYLDEDGDAVMRDDEHNVVCVVLKDNGEAGKLFVRRPKACDIPVKAYLGPPITFRWEGTSGS